MQLQDFIVQLIHQTVSNENALRINTTNLKDAAAINGSVKGYKIADGIVEISAPKIENRYENADNYKVGTVKRQRML